jgi:hypothetical protein
MVEICLGCVALPIFVILTLVYYICDLLGIKSVTDIINTDMTCKIKNKNTNDVNSVIELFGDRYKQIHIYPEAETVSFGDTPIMFVPWINNQNHTETLAKIQETNAQICMGHLEVAGFAMNKGIINEHGISKSIFGKFDS